MYALPDEHYCRKHAAKQDNSREVILICGPPGAGKSTYMEKIRNPGDLIIDLDALYSALGHTTVHDNNQRLLPYVLAARDAIIETLANTYEYGTVIIIACAPDLKTRRRIREQLHAKVIMLDVEPGVCMQRIMADGDRKQGVAYWQEMVDKWWERYVPDAATAREQ